MNYATQRTCDEYRRLTALGEDPSSIVGWLAAEAGTLRPAIWKRLRIGGVMPPYNSHPGQRGRPPGGGRTTPNKVSQERSDFLASAPRVHRDPCPRCGVRGDLECGHSGVRLGMML